MFMFNCTYILKKQAFQDMQTGGIIPYKLDMGRYNN